jgi:hypothetical protein
MQAARRLCRLNVIDRHRRERFCGQLSGMGSVWRMVEVLLAYRKIATGFANCDNTLAYRICRAVTQFAFR